MGTNTLQTRSAGETITADFFNDFNTALQTEFVGRNASGAATSGQGLGSSSVPWGTGYFNSIVLAGSALDTSQITSPPNRIVSGATRSSSNQPHFITANGSALSLTIDGNTTNLVIDVNGTAVTCSTDITVSSLTAAPGSNNTCLVNMSDAADQEMTRYWGEPTNEFIIPQTKDPSTVNPHYETITVDNMGSEISGLVGQYAAFKINDGTNDEFFLAFVKSSTELTQCMRGSFLDHTGAPVNRIKFANNDTITLMKLTWVFLQSDGTTADVTYQPPVWSFDQPGSPNTGDYWYDLGNSQWKRYSGTAFVTINRTLIGIAISDGSNTVATRSFDFYYKYEDKNTIEVVRDSATNCRVANTHGNVWVYSNNLDFKTYNPVWNITADLASTATKDAYASESASTYYYLYFKDTGDRVISDIGPIKRADLLGSYHPNNPWRCVGSVFNNSSSNFEGRVTSQSDKIDYVSTAILINKQTRNNNGGSVSAGTSWSDLKLNSIFGYSYFVSGGFDGINGSNTNFILQPGKYQIDCTVPIYNSGSNGFFQVGLYNVTDSAFVEGTIFGNAIMDTGGTSGSQLHFAAYLKLEVPTEFKAQANGFVSGTVGYIATSGMAAGTNTNTYFTTMRVRKLS